MISQLQAEIERLSLKNKQHEETVKEHENQQRKYDKKLSQLKQNADEEQCTTAVLRASSF